MQEEMVCIQLPKVTFGHFATVWQKMDRFFIFLFACLRKFHPSALDIVVDYFFAGDWLAFETFVEVAVHWLEKAEPYVV